MTLTSRSDAQFKARYYKRWGYKWPFSSWWFDFSGDEEHMSALLVDTMSWHPDWDGLALHLGFDSLGAMQTAASEWLVANIVRARPASVAKMPGLVMRNPRALLMGVCRVLEEREGGYVCMPFIVGGFVAEQLKGSDPSGNSEGVNSDG